MAQRHFTYSQVVDRKSLKQGDILKKSEDLCNVLREYHKYYADTSQYTHFQILTQTCDLVRRGRSDSGQCSARYLTLAAVRPLETVIQRAIEKIIDRRVIVDDVYCCRKRDKDKLSHEIKSLFNNNAKEYFFLKASPEDGLTEDSCTFLQLSIAIRANEHYKLCLDAKLLELEPNFSSKLGWLVGNLYSRVGTTDYVPGALPDDGIFNEHIETVLSTYVVWVEDNIFSEFKKAAQPNLTVPEISTLAVGEVLKVRSQKVNNILDKIATETDMSDDQRRKLKAFMESEQGARIFALF